MLRSCVISNPPMNRNALRRIRFAFLLFQLEGGFAHLFQFMVDDVIFVNHQNRQPVKFCFQFLDFVL